jgi:hypothetical protein
MKNHLEMLEKIADKVGTVSLIGVCAQANDEWNVTQSDNCEILGSSDIPRGAIERAYKKLFPPIPSKVGEGAKQWKWSGAQGGWIPSAWKPDGYIAQKGQTAGGLGYRFSGYVRPDVIKGFLKLIEINPELRAPTEIE